MFTIADATPTSDRVCGGCPDGTFTAKANQPSPCTRVSRCIAGERVVKQASTTHDNECDACPSLTFQSEASHVLTQCTPQTLCPPGTSLPGGGSTTEQAECKPCEPLLAYMDASAHRNKACFEQPTCGPGERYVDSGVTTQASCERCPPLSYQPAPAGHREQECLPQPPCTNGTFFYADAAAAAVRECRDCMPADLEANPPVVGTFMSDTSHYLEACFDHQMCSKGQYEVEGSTTLFAERRCFSHDECSTALEYEMQPPTDKTNRICGLLADCAPGERVATAPTKTSNRECLACANFTWQDTANQDQCRPMSVCGVGEYVSVEGTPSSDLVCIGCSAGTSFQDEAGHRALACKPVRNCTAAVEYESAAPTLVTDRWCTALTECTTPTQPWNGDWESSAPTATTDRVCSPLTECLGEPYEWESVAPTATSDRVCVETTADCEESGKREATAATSTSDRVCDDTTSTTTTVTPAVAGLDPAAAAASQTNSEAGANSGDGTNPTTTMDPMVSMIAMPSVTGYYIL